MSDEWEVVPVDEAGIDAEYPTPEGLEIHWDADEDQVAPDEPDAEWPTDEEAMVKRLKEWGVM